MRGKTGTLDDMFGLTGVTDDTHGDRIAFTVFAEGTADPAARQEIDALAAALWRCGGDADPAAQARTRPTTRVAQRGTAAPAPVARRG